MATNIDTGLTAATGLKRTADPHIFTMSDGYEVVVYYNGTDWGYRIKPSGGSWGSRTSLTSSGTGQGGWLQSGDNILGVVDGTMRVYKLAYSTGTHAITQTNNPNGDTGCQLLGLALDTTNSRVVFIEYIPSAGVFLYSFTISALAMFNEQITVNSPPSSGTPQVQEMWALAANTTNQMILAWAETSTIKCVLISAGTTAAATTETAETGVAAISAACQGIDIQYDGTNFVIVVNENNAKLRRNRRTAANTYDGWTDLVTDTISGPPSICKKGTGAGADLGVLYRVTSGQANGEIYKIQRLGGTWDAAGTLVAGGASTGWNYPSANLSDLNGTSGHVPIVYITGTASTWTLVEDEITISGGGATSKTGGISGACSAGGTWAEKAAKSNGVNSAASVGGPTGPTSVATKSGGFAAAGKLGGTDTIAISKRGGLYMSRGAGGPRMNPKPVVSLGQPAAANMELWVAASAAVDNNYGQVWRSWDASPPNGEPSPSAPQWVRLDISGIANADKTRILCNIRSAPQANFYYSGALGSQAGSTALGLMRDFTIDASPASSAPSDGDASWVNLVTVVNNRYAQTVHELNLAGYHWFRIRVTDASGPSGTDNDDVEFQFDLHNVALGQDDSFFIYGDSIAFEGWSDRVVGTIAWGSSVGPPQNALRTATGRTDAPLIIDGATGGWLAETGDTNKETYIGPFPCKYVILAFGANNSNNATFAWADKNAAPALAYKAALQSLINYCQGRDQVVIIPKVGWANLNTWTLNNVQICNQIVDDLWAENPEVLHGWDAYTFFAAHTNCIRDGLHPTYDTSVSGGLYNGLTGYENYLQSWSNTLNSVVYASQANELLGGTAGALAVRAGGIFSAGKLGGNQIATGAKTGGLFSAGKLGGPKVQAISRTGGIFSAGTLGGSRLFQAVKAGGIFTPARIGGPQGGAVIYTKSGGVFSAGLLGASRSLSQSKTGGESSSASLGGSKALRAVQTGGIRATGTLGGNVFTGSGKTGGIASTSRLGGSNSLMVPRTGGIFSAGRLGGPKNFILVRTGGLLTAGTLGGTHTQRYLKPGGIFCPARLGGSRLRFALSGGFRSIGYLGSTAGTAQRITNGQKGMLLGAVLLDDEDMNVAAGGTATRLLGAQLGARD